MAEVKNWTTWKPAPRMYIRYIGMWDMQLLYTRLADWLMHRKYHLQEKVYKHKHPSPFGVERQYVWEAKRAVSEYEEVVYNIYMHTYDAYEVEVQMPDGKKKKMTRGRILIELAITLNWDWEGRWKKSLFYYRLGAFYNKYIFRNRLMMGLSPKYRSEAWELHKMLEQTLNMYAGKSHEWEAMRGPHKSPV